MNAEDLTVVVPRKENVTEGTEEAVSVWPLVKTTLDRIEADDMTYEAARAAMQRSDGCVVLAHYLSGELEHYPAADERFKVPLVVLAATQAREDEGADSIYDPRESALHFETDDEQYSFSVDTNWTVDWSAVADEEVDGYQWGIEEHTWALDKLMSYLDVGMEDYLVDDDEDNEDEGPERISRV